MGVTTCPFKLVGCEGTDSSFISACAKNKLKRCIVLLQHKQGNFCLVVLGS